MCVIPTFDNQAPHLQAGISHWNRFYFFKKFCVIMREQTEWKELVENGFAAIAGSSKEKIIHLANSFLHGYFSSGDSLYGDGNAGEKIANILEKHLN